MGEKNEWSMCVHMLDSTPAHAFATKMKHAIKITFSPTSIFVGHCGLKPNQGNKSRPPACVLLCRVVTRDSHACFFPSSSFVCLYLSR